MEPRTPEVLYLCGWCTSRVESLSLPNVDLDVFAEHAADSIGV